MFFSTQTLATRQSSITAWADKELSTTSSIHRILHLIIRTILITIAGFKINNLSLRAGALTYTILLSLVPMVAMSTALVKGLGGGDQLRLAAYTYIDSLEVHDQVAVPPVPETSAEAGPPASKENLTFHMRSAVDKLFAYVERTNFATLGSFGVVGMLLSTLLVLNHIEAAMNSIWRVRTGRPLLRKLSDYLTLLILMPFSVNIAFAAGAFLKSPALALKMDTLVPFDWLQSLILKPLPVLFMTFSFYVMYIFFPNTRVKTVPALIGSLLAAVLWFFIQNLYITLQVGVARYNAIYGSFATLPLFLFWMYFGWMFILSGAQIAFAIQHLKSYSLLPRKDSPSLEMAAALDIMDRIHAGFQRGERITDKKLIETLPSYPEKTIKSISKRLLGSQLLHLSKSDGRYLPGRPMKKGDGMQLISIIFGSETPDTEGGKRTRTILEGAGQIFEKK